MTIQGSVWRKWDLHIHSPATMLNNQFAGTNDNEKWNAYIDALEHLGEYGALGITDYFSIDGYLRTKEFKSQGRLENVAEIFPNIELRILPVTESVKAINIHVITCPTIVPELNEVLFGNLEFTYDGNAHKCTRDGLVRLGRAHSRDTSLEERQAYLIGVQQFKIDYNQLAECFRKSRRLRQLAIIAVANRSGDGNSGIQGSGFEAVRQEIYRLSDVIFSGVPNDREYFLGRGVDDPEQIRSKLGGLKPCVHGCDAHSLDKLGNPDLSRHTWIKADPSFEGLRQILFEPSTRVSIGSTAPPTPIHRIRRVRIDLPDDTQMHWEGSEQPFCLRGHTELAFAPGLTCVIGGRGAGKSTLLNLLHERLASGANSFWKDHQLRTVNGVAISLNEVVAVDFAGDNATVEFISQNEVEALALDPSRLTAAVYSRLQTTDGSGDLAKSTDDLRQAGKASERRIDLLRLRYDLSDKIADIQGRIEGCTQLLTCYSDPDYVIATTKLQGITVTRAELRDAREQLAALVSALSSVIGSREVMVPTSLANEYRDAADKLIVTVRDALTIAIGGVDLSRPGIREVQLDAEAAEARSRIENFLKERGLSPENLSDLASATEQKAGLQQELRKFEQQLMRCNEEFSVLKSPTSLRPTVEALIQQLLATVNNHFEGGPAEAQRIEICYRFDREAAEEAAVQWLIEDISRLMPSSRPRVDHAKNALSRAGDILVTSDVELVTSVKQDETKTGQTLDIYFAKPPRLEVWRVIREKLLADVPTFMRLDILYDGKRLEQTSFGQRCSAVLVVLLSLGNRPIIVDEPEAHLDSALIANFMVDLVKRVKAQRQVIFATHNANFVVNGDAELVHILTPDFNARSEVRSATIEDLTARKFILSLEGGERAFKQREGRYGLDP